MAKKSIWPKIIIPVLIIAIVAAIFIWRQNDDEIDTSLAMPLDITEVDLKAITSQGLPVILEFGADGCPPCDEMRPALIRLNEVMQGKAIVQSVDIWKYPDTAKGFPVQTIPTLFFLNSDGSPYVPGEHLTTRLTVYTASSDSDEHIYTAYVGKMTETQLLEILADMGVST